MSLFLLGILNSQAAGAAAGAYDLLETQVLTSSASSVTFTGLGSYTDYKHLQLRATVRASVAASGVYTYQMRLNSDSGSNYASHRLKGNGSSVTSTASSSQNHIAIEGVAVGDNEATGIFAGLVMDILDFSSSSKNTTTRTLSGETAGPNIHLQSGLYNNSGAITSLEFGLVNGLQTGSRFSLYGVK